MSLSSHFPRIHVSQQVIGDHRSSHAGISIYSKGEELAESLWRSLAEVLVLVSPIDSVAVRDPYRQIGGLTAT